MKINDVQLITSAVQKDRYPAEGLPEVAFVGRSNVGKSSLINTLVQRKNMARTSSQPGKTQTLNFYNVNDQFHFVDVPGYGYAKTSKKNREKFGQMVEEFLSTRKTLRGVLSLVDARHLPTEDDVLMYNWLNYYNINILLVATKIDKVPNNQWNKVESNVKKTLGFNPENSYFIPFSSVNKTGEKEIWEWIIQNTEN